MFPADLERDYAVTIAQTRHNWKRDGKKLYCDGCSEMAETTKKPKGKPKQEKGDEGTIALGE